MANTSIRVERSAGASGASVFRTGGSGKYFQEGARIKSHKRWREFKQRLWHSGSNEASAWTRSVPTTLTALVKAGTLELDMPVRFAFTVKAHRSVPIASPDHKFLESVTIPAFELPDAYIEVMPVPGGLTGTCPSLAK